jgi:hypothetical protein
MLIPRPLHVDFPSLGHVYPVRATDILVNSVGGCPTNRSYRDISSPIHVEPAAKLRLSPQALAILTDLQKPE